jgi:hypothetical protein
LQDFKIRKESCGKGGTGLLIYCDPLFPIWGTVEESIVTAMSSHELSPPAKICFSDECAPTGLVSQSPTLVEPSFRRKSRCLELNVANNPAAEEAICIFVLHVMATAPLTSSCDGPKTSQ